MKKAFTLIETMTIAIIICSLVAIGFCIYNGGIGNYTAEEILMPEETKARYQRLMVEELRRSNDLKEKEQQDEHP